MSVNNDTCRELEQEADSKKNLKDILNEIEKNDENKISSSEKVEVKMECCEEEKAIGLKLIDSSKRRHSETEIDNAIVKKSKIEPIKELKSCEYSENTDSAMATKSQKNDELEKTTTIISGNPIKIEEDDETDDLLERLEAIDATNLRKPDLKLEEIDRTDLEKDDLLQRLEDAENGIESIMKENSFSPAKTSTETDIHPSENKEIKKEPADAVWDSVITESPSIEVSKIKKEEKDLIEEKDEREFEFDKTVADVESQKSILSEKFNLHNADILVITDIKSDKFKMNKAGTSKEMKENESKEQKETKLSTTVDDSKSQKVEKDKEQECEEQSSIVSDDNNLHLSETKVIEDISLNSSSSDMIKLEIISDSNNMEVEETQSDDNSDDVKLQVTPNAKEMLAKQEIDTSMEINADEQLSDSTLNSINSTNEELIKFTNETTINSNNVSMLEKNNSKATTNLDTKIKENIFSNVLMMNNGGSSTPNSNNVSTSTLNVFKPFEISSENVSKISNEKLLLDKTIGNSHNNNDSSITEESTEKSSTDGCSQSETDSHTSDEIKSYAKVIKQCNGLSEIDESEPKNVTLQKICKIETSGVDSFGQNYTRNILSLENGSNLDSSNEIHNDSSLYEICLWYEEKCIRFISFDKNKKPGRLASLTDLTTSGTDSLSKRSSNGSVNSLGPFPLPSTTTTSRLSLVSSSNSSGSQKNDGKFAIPALPPKSKYTVKGVLGLCNFMIDHFTKMKQNLKDESSESLEQSSDSSSVDAPKNKADLVKKSINPKEIIKTDDKKSKQPKSIKRNTKSTTSTSTVTNISHLYISSEESINDFQELSKIGCIVLARWNDRKYYAGRIIEVKSDKKYVVRFEDNATKTLPHYQIVFGTDDILPLLDQSIHVLTGDNTYECGLVTSFKKFDNIIKYNVTTDTGDLLTTSTDIYLTDEQAKTIQNLFKNDDMNMSTASATSSSNKRTVRKVQTRYDNTNQLTPSTTTAITSSSGKTTRGKRNERTPPTTQEIQPGFSGAITKKGRRAKRTQQQQVTISESDISDTMESDSAPNSPNCEAVYGVQPELQKTPKESELHKIRIIAEYLGNDKTKYAEDIQGPIPNSKAFFRNKHFILTCTIAMKIPRTSTTMDDADDMKNKYKKFTTVPFFKDHTKKQIEAAGGKVYNHFEEVPKKNYRNCKLIAPHPITTAKYIQCLAADIPAVSHEWIIECCRQNSMVDFKPYALPSGWSLIDERYIKWTVGRNPEQRSNSTPLSNQTILLVSQNKDFIKLWSRVCVLAGGKIKLIKLPTDLTQGQSGYLVIDDEFPEEIKSIAELFNIPIFGTVWIVQSLILGKILSPDAHKKLTQFQDDDY